MTSLLDQLIQEHGDEINRKITNTLGVTHEEAAAVFSAAAPVLLERFESAPTTTAVAPENLDDILGGTGEQMNERIRGELGVSPEQASRVIPLLVPVVLKFLMRQVPLGNVAVPVLVSLVEKQGYGSLDTLARQLARNFTPSPSASSLPTLLGRWAGKYFPSGE